jgi:lipopolysaccharide export system protein LptC
MKRLYFISVIIFICSLAWYGYLQWGQEIQNDTTASEQELKPDFIAEALNSKIFNKSGQLAFSISASKMEHYDELGFTQFEQPQYTIYPSNQSAPWLLTANEATLSENARLSLESRVRLKATDEHSLIQEIHGKYLELNLKINLISSDQALMIQGKDFTMYGSGLIVDLNTTQMTLTEHVQTIYKKISR